MPTIFRDRVTLGALDFNYASGQPADAQVWGVDVMEGWKTSPDMTVYASVLGGERDGEVSGDFAPLQARHLLVGGYVKAATRAQAEALHDIIVRDGVPRNRELLLVRYETVPKFLRVKREGPIETDWPMEDGFRWQVTLRADDPFRYGLTEVSGSAGTAGQSSGGRRYPRTYPLRYLTVTGGDNNLVVLVNDGTAPTWPVATLTGPLPAGGWRLSNETVGGELRYDVDLQTGDVLDIDFQNEVALLNGFPVSGAITGDFWRVVPGPNVIKLYADEALGAGFTITINPAWE
jgi:hypothetical protein